LDHSKTRPNAESSWLNSNAAVTRCSIAIAIATCLVLRGTRCLRNRRDQGKCHGVRPASSSKEHDVQRIGMKSTPRVTERHSVQCGRRKDSRWWPVVCLQVHLGVRCDPVLVDAIQFWQRFEGHLLRGSEFNYPEGPRDLPGLSSSQSP
jgi:hypothetical protein